MQSKTEFFSSCNKILEGNWLKLGFAAALLILSVSVIFGLTGVPVLFLVSQPSAGIFSLLAAIFGLCVMYSLFFILFYGFFVLVIRIYKNDYVTAGFLFYGFRDWKRLFRVGCLYMLALFLASIVFAIPVLLFDFFSKVPLTLLITVLTLCIAALVVALIFPYLFAMYYLYETQQNHGDNHVKPFLKKSRSELRGKKLLLFSLCVTYARRDILLAACSLVAGQALAFVKPAAFLASALGYVYYVLVYVVFIRAVAVCTVFYYSLQSPRIEMPQPAQHS